MLICNWNCVKWSQQTRHLSHSLGVRIRKEMLRVANCVSSSQPSGVIILMAVDDVSTQDLMMSALALVHDPPVTLSLSPQCVLIMIVISVMMLMIMSL